MYYISTDPTITSANLLSALASLNDEELREILGGSCAYREQMITEWMMKVPAPTWEYLAGRCFHKKKQKALDEVKKHFKRKLGTTIMTNNIHINKQTMHIRKLIRPWLP